MLSLRGCSLPYALPIWLRVEQPLGDLAHPIPVWLSLHQRLVSLSWLCLSGRTQLLIVTAHEHTPFEAAHPLGASAALIEEA